VSTDDQKGQLRAVAEPGNCRSNELPIEWSVTGPPGPPGPEGPAGPAGQDGEDGTPFSGTFTSPNGQYSLSVTDAGIRLAGVGSTILLDATGIRVDSATALTIRSAQSTSLRAGADLTAEASSFATLKGAGVTVDSASLMRLAAPVVRLGPGAGCTPVARLGDLITGTAAGAAVSGQIVSGAPAVCTG
jgi:hypothetical protein